MSRGLEKILEDETEQVWVDFLLPLKLSYNANALALLGCCGDKPHAESVKKFIKIYPKKSL